VLTPIVRKFEVEVDMNLQLLAQFSFWEEVAKIAPLGTAVIALVAATIAIISLRTQVSIARKRAAIDIFLKTEMDPAMLAAYQGYKDGLKAFKAFVSAEEFVAQEPKKYDAIRTYLDVNELICIGINEKVFDQRVCYGFWANILNVAATEGKSIIAHARCPKENIRTYEEVLKVSRRWDGAAWPWQRWRM
jgi:hypothetical protein